MGELLRQIAHVRTSDTVFVIEENDSGKAESIIHLQSASSRIEMSESEFIQLCALFVVAFKAFEDLKAND